MNEIKWHSIKKEGFPKEDGTYLITIKGNFETPNFIYVARFANDLHKIGKYQFCDKVYENKKGFYDFDSEFGYYDIDNVTAWVKEEPYEGE